MSYLYVEADKRALLVTRKTEQADSLYTCAKFSSSHVELQMFWVFWDNLSF